MEKCLKDFENTFLPIIEHLSVYETIKLASTNQAIKKKLIENSSILKSILEFSCLNFNLFPMDISHEEADMVYSVFPEVRKIRANLLFSNDRFFTNIAQFSKLDKLSVYAHAAYENTNSTSLPTKSVTIRSTFQKSKKDAIYNVLSSFPNIERFSLYNGNISEKTIQGLKRRELKILKIHNSIIEDGIGFVKLITQNDTLRYIKMTTDNYKKYPAPMIIMSEILKEIEKNNMK